MRSARKTFLANGFIQGSIDRIAAGAGVSTRTIYEHYGDKAALFEAVVERMFRTAIKSTSGLDLECLEPESALRVVAIELTAEAKEPESAALFRLIASESRRFPALAARMCTAGKGGLTAKLATYLRRRRERFAVRLSDTDNAAKLFRQMILGDLQECWLWGGEGALAEFDLPAHIDHVIASFLEGAAP